MSRSHQLRCRCWHTIHFWSLVSLAHIEERLFCGRGRYCILLAHTILIMTNSNCTFRPWPDLNGFQALGIDYKDKGIRERKMIDILTHLRLLSASDLVKHLAMVDIVPVNVSPPKSSVFIKRTASHL